MVGLDAYIIFCFNQGVNSIKVPGIEGEFGVTAGHVPIIAQLKPGVVSIIHDAVINLLAPL